jgi:DNA topoisomerase-2
MPGFLVEFITPIVKVTKGNVTHAFYTIPEYEAWKESTANVKSWRIKYYKGMFLYDLSSARENVGEPPS